MDIQARIDKIADGITEALTKIETERTRFQQSATRNWRLHVLFGATLAILGVAAPALVTYQTQVDDPVYQLLAIILTSIVGAAAVLQATFRWGDRYRRSSLTSLALEELHANVETRMAEWQETDDKLLSHQKLAELRDWTQRELRRILREQVEAELAISSHEPAEGGSPTPPSRPGGVP